MLKESGFIRINCKTVEPAWRKFGEFASKYLSVQPNSELAQAIDYLVTYIPEVQISKDNWKPIALHGGTKTEQAIDAVARVRNNLFHGGKHTPHSPLGRDEMLIRMSFASYMPA
jgi:hypothetical protein